MTDRKAQEKAEIEYPLPIGPPAPEVHKEIIQVPDCNKERCFLTTRGELADVAPTVKEKKDWEDKIKSIRK